MLCYAMLCYAMRLQSAVLAALGSADHLYRRILTVILTVVVVGSSAHTAGPDWRRLVRRSAGAVGAPWVDAWEAHNRSGRPRKRAARHADAKSHALSTKEPVGAGRRSARASARPRRELMPLSVAIGCAGVCQPGLPLGAIRRGARAAQREDEVLDAAARERVKSLRSRPRGNGHPGPS